MTLAQVINKAMQDPDYRHALLTGALDLNGSGLSTAEVSAITKVMSIDLDAGGATFASHFALATDWQNGHRPGGSHL